jgi:hypothetical protein
MQIVASVRDRMEVVRLAISEYVEALSEKRGLDPMQKANVSWHESFDVRFAGDGWK